jgi:hypothetical protein
VWHERLRLSLQRLNRIDRTHVDELQYYRRAAVDRLLLGRTTKHSPLGIDTPPGRYRDDHRYVHDCVINVHGRERVGRRNGIVV